MKNSLKWQWLYQKRTYLLVFFIPFFIMYFAYSSFGVHPFGKNSVLVLDLNGQYVYYFEALRDAIWGDSSVIYSWSRNLSGEMFGIFAYYLASPFTLIPMLLPRSMMLGALELMQLCKIGAAALTFAIYLKNRKHSKFFPMLIFSTIYSLMAYSVVQLMNPMWLDGLIYLPLIVLGIEKLVDEGRKVSLIIPLALMFMANFYIGYMVGFFSAIYFIYYCFSRDDTPTLKEFLKSVLRFTISAGVAVMCAMVIIFPVYNSLKLGKLEFTNPDFALKTQFNIIDFLTKLFPFSYDTVRPEGLPVVYCGAITILLLPLYFLNRNIKTKQKVANGVLLSAIFLCMYLSTIDIAWHGFQVPNWLPYRYSFVFCFVLIVMATQAFEHLEGISFKEIGGSFFGILVFLIYAESQNFEHFKPLNAILPSVITMSIYFAVLYFSKKYKGNTASIITVVFVCAELFIVSLQTLYAINTDVVYSTFSSYKGYVEDGREVVDRINSEDSGLFRSEKTFHRTVNDPMAFGLKGISHSSSTMNAPVIELLSKLGFTSRGHYTKYTGATEVTDALLGIKYVLNKDKTVYDYDLKYTQNAIGVYENPNALSIGFMVSDEIKLASLDDFNPFINQNTLIGAMVGGNSQPVFNKIFSDEVIYENVNVENAGDHTKYTKITDGIDTYLRFKITAPTDDLIYLFFPSNYERTVNLWVNGEFLGVYFETDNYCIVPVGKFQKGEEITIQTTLLQDELYMKDQCFFYLDETAFSSAISNLKSNQWNITKFSDTNITGEITAKDDEIMFTSISFEPGWNVKIDGKKVEPIKLVGSLIGIEVPAGTHTVSMSFFPKYFLVGILVSIGGVILIVVIWILEKRSKKLLLNRLLS